VFTREHLYTLAWARECTFIFLSTTQMLAAPFRVEASPWNWENGKSHETRSNLL